MLSERAKSISIFLCSLLLCGLFAVFLGKELCWDLANYHYYNPYAYLYHRESMDYWPSSYLHVHLIPTMDFLTYFLVNHFSAMQVTFLLGVLHGVNGWLLFEIAYLFIQHSVKKYRTSLAVGLTIAGMYGPTVLPGIGSFQNDNIVSLFVLGFVFLQAKALQYYQKERYLFFLLFAGVLLGISVGLKYTAALYAVGALISFALLPMQLSSKVKGIFLSGSAISLGFLLSAGYWMVTLWQHYHNPVFPFLNGVFHSPDFPTINFNYTQFLPQHFLQWVFFPFYFSSQGTVITESLRDFRFSILYVLFIVLGVKWLMNRCDYYKEKDYSLLRRWLYGFFIASYIVWECCFSLMRYMNVLEMLAPLMIFLVVMQITKNALARFSLLTIIFSILVIFMVPIPMIRAPWYGKNYLNVTLPSWVKTTPAAMVLMAYPAYALYTNPRPQTYLIPFFPKQWHFIGVPFINENQYAYDKKIAHAIQTRVERYQGLFYVLSPENNVSELLRVAKGWGLSASGPCHDIMSDRQRITHERVLICPVSRKIIPS
jgi:hypothetical protein